MKFTTTAAVVLAIVFVVSFVVSYVGMKRGWWADLKARARAWLDAELIPGWEKAHKLLSVKFDLYAGAAVIAWLAVPEADRQALADMLHISPMAMMLAGIAVRLYLRLRPQPELHKDE